MVWKSDGLDPVVVGHSIAGVKLDSTARFNFVQKFLRAVFGIEPKDSDVRQIGGQVSRVAIFDGDETDKALRRFEMPFEIQFPAESVLLAACCAFHLRVVIFVLGAGFASSERPIL